MTWNFEDCVSDIFYDALKKHFPSSWHWCLYFTAVIHTFICLYGKMILCKLAGHKEIFILFMANANANLYQLILSSTLTHHFFSYCFTKVSIFMSGSSVKIMFTSCICLFSNFGNCQPEIYFFLVLHKIWLRISPMCNVKRAVINLWFLLVTSYTELVGL